MSAPTPSPPAAPLPGSAPVRAPAGRKRWLFRAAAATLVPAIVFGLLELGLRVGGYGHPTRFFLDGTSLERPGTLIDNRDFGRWAFPRGLERTPFPVPFAIRTEKPDRTVRVFVLGESAAMGFPDPSSSFPRVLEVMLRARYPDADIEVVNASMVAINSHIVAAIARECAARQPDLFVVHLGNNEVVGPFGAAGVLGSFAPGRGAARLNLAVRQTRTGQLLDSFTSGLRGGRKEEWKGMSMFLDRQVAEDDPRLAAVYDNFRRNLGDVFAAAAGSGVPAIVCTIPVNLRDCAPFGSAHTPGLAADRAAAWDALFRQGNEAEAAGRVADSLARYEGAAAIDDRHAELAFRRARCLLAANRPADAATLFARARDLDTLRFRSDATINRVIREVAADRVGRGVHLADAEQAFRDASPHGIPGEELFLEHVHMNFSGNYHCARAVFGAAAPILDARLTPGPKPDALSEPECADRLAYTDWNKLQVFTEVRYRILPVAPFTGQSDQAAREQRWEARCRELRRGQDDAGRQRAIDRYLLAVRGADRDWMLRMNFGQLLSDCNLTPGAEEQYRAAADLLHHAFPAWTKLGQICLQTGRIDEAESHFRKVVAIAPDLPDGHVGGAEVLGARGKVAEGLAIYEKWMDKMPSRAAALIAVGGYLRRAGRADEARARFLEAAEADPADPAAHVQLGNMALTRGNRDEAVAMYEAALRRRPDWPDMKAHLDRTRAAPAP